MERVADAIDKIGKKAGELSAAMVLQTLAPVSGGERRAALDSAGDTLGVMLSGAADPRARALFGTLSSVARETAGLARLPGGRAWVSPSDAALILGFCAHLLDFDDDETEVAMAHLSAPCLSAALAVAGMSGMAANGTDLIDAYVAGCQVMLTVGSAVNPALYKAGWHATSVLGAFGAAAAAARLFRLNAEQIGHAFGLVASLASGPRGAFGGEGKPLQVGQAAGSGVRAAALAQAGWKGASGAVAGDRGALTRMAGALSASGYAAPGPFPPPGFVTKPYPSCTATHSAVAEILSLMPQAGRRRGGDIVRIRCAVDRFVPQILISHLPVSPDEGRFSLPYCIAHAVVHGDLSPSAFSDESFSPDGPRDAEVRQLMGRVAIAADDSLPKGESGISTGADISIVWADGFRLDGRRETSPGSQLTPLSSNALQEKFQRCLSGLCTSGDADGLWRRIQALTDASHAGTFIDALPDVFKPQGQEQ